MTNTKFRKRALLSSVAMLLVALVALGSATFAWYSANLNVNTDGKLGLKTTSASGLLIISDTDRGDTAVDAVDASVWDHEATLSHAQTAVQPVSFDVANKKFYTAVASEEGVAAAADDPEIADAASTDLAREKVYFKLEAGSTTGGFVNLKSVTFNREASKTISNGIRIVIFDSAGNVVAEYAPNGRTVSKEEWISGASAQAATVKKGDTDGKDITTAPNGAVTAATVSEVSQTPSDANYCEIVAYLDGGDTNVHTVNSKAAVAAELIASMRLDFTFSTTRTGA